MSDGAGGNKKRGNVILFWVHVVLAVLILCGFVYATVHK